MHMKRGGCAAWGLTLASPQGSKHRASQANAKAACKERAASSRAPMAAFVL